MLFFPLFRQFPSRVSLENMSECVGGWVFRQRKSKDPQIDVRPVQVRYFVLV